MDTDLVFKYLGIIDGEVNRGPHTSAALRPYAV